MAKSKKSYYELLRDPRWQRKRLEIMERSDFSCEQCGSNSKTLNVHHSYYEKGNMPWEYPSESLHCLCEACHKSLHETKKLIDMELSCSRSMMLEVIGYMLGRHHFEGLDCVDVQITSFQMALGYGAAWGCTAHDVIGKLDDKGILPGYALVDVLLEKHNGTYRQPSCREEV